MARLKSIAAVLAVLALPGLAVLTGLLVAPDAPPPNVPAVVRIGESLEPTPRTSSAPASTPLPPPPPTSDDGDDDDDDG